MRGLCTSVRLSNADRFRSTYDRFSLIRGGSIDLSKDEDSGIALITLNHTERKNAMSGKMMCDLADVVTELESWSSGKGVIVHGAGRTFCSGGDLNFVKQIFSHEEGLEMSEFMHNVMTRLYNLPLISVALLEGVAYGGGAEIATACDFRVMSDQAKLGFVQARMGVLTGWGGGTRLVGIVGRSNALKILTSAKVMESHECKRMGLVDEIFPEGGSSMALTQKWLQQYCVTDSSLIQSFKTVVANADRHLDVLMEERKLFSQTWSSDLHIQAMKQNIKH
ncbi:hypothetical protein FSP39_000721 [Pinctada imbricata]|uniref:Ethylmalonyl-CoA decarboxylase n=1 Tax=Pinctada imbricata TaxID=66713 RepID=A0AA89BPE5_PINIB|nr:hypothetical protein FSP39_000721 [Pinctada imbricata]